jgi:DNA polymerase (family 10)
MNTLQSENSNLELLNKFSSYKVYPIAEEWLNQLTQLPGIQHGEISGELRRGSGSTGCIDLVLAAGDPQRTAQNILDLGEPEALHKEKVEGRISMLLPGNLKLVIWITQPENFSITLLQTTGSEDHLLQLAKLASSQGMQLTRSGFWKSGQLLQFNREEKIYAALSIPWIPPELRENSEIIDQAKKMNLPHLIIRSDIQSDLHMHTDWTDGKDSIEEMVKEALKLNLVIIAISDHSPYLMKRYQDTYYFLEQGQVIEQIREKFSNQINILKGAEVDILPDGSLDLPEAILKKMDIVIASIHFALDQPRDQITTRLIRAIENPYVNIIGHPGGKLSPVVEIADLDWERVYTAAAFNQVALEINSHHSHSIFDDQKVRAAVKQGVLITINNDAHSKAMLNNTRYGLAIARRAGLSSDQVINTWSANHLKLWLNHKKEIIAKVQ